MSDTETLCKLYLELANVVPADCVSSREIALRDALRQLGAVYIADKVLARYVQRIVDGALKEHRNDG